jgi:indoleamine 2,3-dioxygenase
MDKPHRDFLEFLGKSPSIRGFCMDNGLSAEFYACVEGMKGFRDDHIKMVTRYIIIPSGRGAKKEEKVRGTGGTDLVPFLKQMRDESC